MSRSSAAAALDTVASSAPSRTLVGNGLDVVIAGREHFDQPDVHLALGPSTLMSVGPETLAEVGGWNLASTAHAERDEPFNAIRVLAQAEGDVKIAVGPHRGCPGPAPPAPPEAAGLTQVSIQPADVPDCTRWFSIDLYLDGGGRIVVVQLDLGSP